ncbi:MAG: hypothetical protein JO099_25330, partial [Acidobacteriia bacterium]|nr:hypothetical protein [Terriglobia bacterium]
QPDPALDFYRQLGVDEIFAKSEREWRSFHSGIEWQLPDPEWNAALLAIPAHLAMAFNDGAPDVTAINYNTYTRDAAYIINVLQKAGASRLSRLGVRYLLRHPFSGRPFPEADNPGQVIWSADREEAFSGDPLFAREAMPRIRQLAILISWLRTTPVPHFVDPRTLEYGGDSKNGRRVRLEPGDCDGHHPEYTEAFDVAGLRAAADLAEAAGNSRDAAAWRSTAAMLLSNYDREFSKELENGYGRYSVLWPCHLYGLNDQKVRATFYGLGPQRMKSWRYFPLAAAHQSLLAGNRAAGAETIKSHLNSEMMSGWDVLDEGGPSASGGWQRVRTLWPRNVKEPGLNASVAEPHGWALAELWLLMRDALVFEDGSELRLLAGVPPSWFEEGEWGIGGVPVQEGRLTLQYVRRGDSGILETSLAGRSERTFVLNFAAATEATITAAGQTTRCAAGAECLVRFARGPVRVQFQERGR